jgi:hypothetical protein
MKTELEKILKECMLYFGKENYDNPNDLSNLEGYVEEFISEEGITNLYDRLKGVSGWISVEDRLPEEGNRYWCYVEEINSLGKSHFQWNCYYDETNKTWSDNFKTMKVTHWMPLPESPKSK